MAELSTGDAAEAACFQSAKPLGTVAAPLRIQLYAWEPELPATLRERLLLTLSWENRDVWVTTRVYGAAPGIYTSGTRSLTLALDPAESEALRDHTPLPLRALQLKGCIFVKSTMEGATRVARLDHIIPPTGRAFREHAVYVTDIDDNGLFVRTGEKAQRTEGAMLLPAMARERINTKVALERGQVTPMALGFGLFDDLSFRNQRVGLLLLGVYDRWNARLNDFFTTVPYTNPYLPQDRHLIAPHPACAAFYGLDSDYFGHAPPGPANRFIREFFERLAGYTIDLFRGYGHGIVRAHRAGLSMYSPHLENVLPLRDALVLHDWEFARDVSQESTARQVGFFCLDLRNLLNQLNAALRHAEATGHALLARVRGEVDVFAELLVGYGLTLDEARKISADLSRQCQATGRCDDGYVQTRLMPTIARTLFN